MSTKFRADNIGSLLRTAELLQARADYGEEPFNNLNELRQGEDGAILATLDMQRATGIEVFTDGEYCRHVHRRYHGAQDLGIEFQILTRGKIA